MMRDVQGIPPAPRPVRWNKVLGYRWPLGALAFVLAVYGGVWTWMLFLAHGGAASDDWLLDDGPTKVVTARVVEVEPERGSVDGQPADVVSYVFTWKVSDSQEATEWNGSSFVVAGTSKVGDSVRVELLPKEPNHSRIVGARANLLPAGFKPQFWLWLLVAPGVVFGLGYVLGALHLRHILVHGDVSVAQSLAVRRVPLCLPEMWSVAFSFRDRNARERRSRHWVRAHSPLGARLRRIAQGANERIPVLHDRRFPRFCRLVLPDDFMPDSHPHDHAATIPH